MSLLPSKTFDSFIKLTWIHENCIWRVFFKPYNKDTYRLKVWMEISVDRPGEEEGDGGRQKSQSEDRSQLSGELEESDPGDSSALPSSCSSKLGP